MAMDESLKQELVVGLYDRGSGLEGSRRILDIGTSKVLKSGIWSPYLVNFRPALSLDEQSSVPLKQQARAKSLLLEAMGIELDTLAQELPFFHIFGLPEAGTPLASAVSGVSGHSLLWQRVKPKEDYGSHQALEGIYLPGQSVVEVDDVVTTAKTKREGAEFLAQYDLRVPAVVVGFDRQQGGREAVEALGMKLRAALGALTAFGYLEEANRLSRTEHDYLVEYTLNPAPTAEPADHPWK